MTPFQKPVVKDRLNLNCGMWSMKDYESSNGVSCGNRNR